jgi:hypothetical protein
MLITASVSQSLGWAVRVNEFHDVRLRLFIDNGPYSSGVKFYIGPRQCRIPLDSRTEFYLVN